MRGEDIHIIWITATCPLPGSILPDPLHDDLWVLLCQILPIPTDAKPRSEMKKAALFDLAQLKTPYTDQIGKFPDT